jgi:hypothetical protein
MMHVADLRMILLAVAYMFAVAVTMMAVSAAVWFCVTVNAFGAVSAAVSTAAVRRHLVVFCCDGVPRGGPSV